MKDTPPWWWKFGWTLAEAIPKPKPPVTPGSLSGSLRKKTAAKTESVVSGALRTETGKDAGRSGNIGPKPQGFWPSNKKKGGW